MKVIEETNPLPESVPIRIVYPPHMPADNAKIVVWIDRQLRSRLEKPGNALPVQEALSAIIFAGQVRKALVAGSLVIHDHTELFET